MTEAFVHESSVVDEGAQLGPGTKIWHFSHVSTGARIGSDCTLGQNVFIGEGVSVGDRCKIGNGVSVFEGVTLEDDVFIGPSAVFTNVRTPRAAISRRGEFAGTLVRRGASIGANVTVVCGVKVGSFALVGAGAVVTHDVAAHAVVFGNPAVRHSWACECGEVLEDWSDSAAECKRCRRRYQEQAGDLLQLGQSR